jgi:hypothetical protein
VVEHPDWQIHTEVIKLDEDHVVSALQTSAILRVSTIATGHAFEDPQRSSSQMQSDLLALENSGDESAVGRALGFLDYGSQEMLRLLLRTR